MLLKPLSEVYSYFISVDEEADSKGKDIAQIHTYSVSTVVRKEKQENYLIWRINLFLDRHIIK